MAYSIPSLSTASNYLASYRQVKPVDGFEDVLSTTGVDTFARQQELEFAAKVGMAKQALNNLTQKMINEDNIKYYEGRDDKLLKGSKITALAGLMGNGSSSSAASSSDGLFGPLDSLNAFNKKVDNSYGYVDTTGQDEALTTAAVINQIFGTLDAPTKGAPAKSTTQQQLQQPKLQLLDSNSLTNLLRQSLNKK